MKQLKFLLIFSSLLLQSFITTAQVIETGPANERTGAEARIAQYRQSYWDSLPTPLSWTNDYIWLFTPEQRDHLDSLITGFENKTTAEISIVTLDTFCTAIEKFDDLALHIAQSWGIGKKDKNNGILICIAPGYRRIRICNGSGIEQYLTDVETQKIINKNIIPHFINGNYFAGTLEGLNAIILFLAEKLKAD